MSYRSKFDGAFTITPPLNAAEATYLEAFLDHGAEWHAAGPYTAGRDVQDADWGYVGPADEGIPAGPCHLYLDTTGATTITASECNSSDTWPSTDWLRFIIDRFLKPDAALRAELANRRPGRYYAPEFDEFTFDHTVSGQIHVQGEERADWHWIVARDNVVYDDTTDYDLPGEPPTW